MIATRVARGTNGMVASGHELATAAAVAVLEDGGNALDASVAAAAVLAVVCPYASTLGGDVYMLIHDAAGGGLLGLNGTGRSPAAAGPERLTDGIPRTGALSATVPGFVAGLQEALDRCGTRSLAELLPPAIRYAAEGFPVHPVLAQNIDERAGLIARDPAAAAIFLPEGKPPGVGDVLVQGDLAATLGRIAEEGAGALYGGELGRRLAEGCAAAGGLVAAEDLARHQTLWQPPMVAPFHGHEVATMPPNSYGLTLLLQLLELEAGGIGQVDPDSAEFVCRGLAARRDAYAAAAELIGDPAALEAPARRQLKRALAAAGGTTGAPARETGGGCTTNVVAMDGRGNAVSLIQSISAPFGSGVVPHGTGVLLNNRMGGFSADPESPNRLAPGKRPAHTLAPCMVLAAGRPVISLGTPGAVGQTCTLAQVLARVLACGQGLEDAIAAPRWSMHIRGGPIAEAAMDPRTRGEIAEREPDFKVMPTGWQTFGSIKAVAAEGHGFVGFADGRRAAAAAGW